MAKKNDDVIKNVQNAEVEEKIKQYKEYRTLKEQIEATMKNLSADIQDFLTEIGEDNIAVGEYKVKLTHYSKSTFDKNIVKEEAPELYEKASGSTDATRLTIN
jgi:translation initiation factor 2 alpha subunit (eIF-2alpha)